MADEHEERLQYHQFRGRPYCRYWVFTDDGEIAEADCYGVDYDPTIWFVPKFGFSGCLGFTVFETKELAIDEAEKRAIRHVERANRVLSKIRSFRYVS